MNSGKNKYFLVFEFLEHLPYIFISCHNNRAYYNKIQCPNGLVTGLHYTGTHLYNFAVKMEIHSNDTFKNELTKCSNIKLFKMHMIVLVCCYNQRKYKQYTTAGNEQNRKPVLNCTYSETCLKQSLKGRPKKYFKTDNRL